MKDAYSFHTSQEDLEKTYQKFYDAYVRIYRRCGAKNVIAVKSDSGMMGGSVSHEFMLLTDIGEDTLAICPDCGYSANMEVASCDIENEAGEIEALEKISTPNVKTIEGLRHTLGVDSKRFAKAVVYQRNRDDSYIIVFIRGDLEVNETKLRNYLGEEVHPAAVISEDSGICAGYIGPIGLPEGIKTVYDRSLLGINSLVCGANEENFHLKGLNIARDVGEVEYVDAAKVFEGAVCPVCGKPSIVVKRGIEVGNIFQLGTKYTKSMNMTYLDRDGEAKNPIMGCYGIGVGRLMASVCEESCDKFGPVWPISIAPWQVEICNLRSTDEGVTKVAEDLYKELTRLGVEVLYDDRDIRPGSMFADADLFGVPVRVVVSPKNCDAGVVEVSTRDKTVKTEYASFDMLTGQYVTTAAISDDVAEFEDILKEKLAAKREQEQRTEGKVAAQDKRVRKIGPRLSH